MELRITVADDKAPRIIGALSERWGYAQFLVDNPGTTPTQAQFVKQHIEGYIKDEARLHLEAEAMRQARTAMTPVEL